MEETKITSKFQTTIPRRIRKFLKVKAGEEVEWEIVKGFVVIDMPRKVDNPVEFLTSQIKLNRNAIELVREARKEFL